MGLPSISLSRSTALQLGAVAAIGVATVASGGTLAPLFASVLGGIGAKVAGDAVVGLIPNILSGLFSDKVKGDQGRADRARRSKQNHDIQKAINGAIAKCLRMAAASYPEGVKPPEYLTSIAASIEQNPLSLVIVPTVNPGDTAASAIDETAITKVLSGDIATIRGRDVLTTEQWTGLLRLAGAATQSLSPTLNVSKGVEFCQEHFTAQLVQALKEAGAESDPAWFAVVLRFLGEIHADVKEIKGDVRTQSAAIEALQKAFKDHAEAISKAFEAMKCGYEERVASDRAALFAIESIASDLASDLPEMNAVLGRIESMVSEHAAESRVAHARTHGGVGRLEARLEEAVSLLVQVSSGQREFQAVMLKPSRGQ